VLFLLKKGDNVKNDARAPAQLFWNRGKLDFPMLFGSISHKNMTKNKLIPQPPRVN
jgi:hypothetical protein